MGEPFKAQGSGNTKEQILSLVSLPHPQQFLGPWIHLSHHMGGFGYREPPPFGGGGEDLIFEQIALVVFLHMTLRVCDAEGSEGFSHRRCQRQKY